MATRRRLIGGALVLGAGYLALRHGVPAITARLSPLPAFEPLARPAGFRALPLGPVSRGLDPMIGLDRPREPGIGPERLEGRLCAALFGAAQIPAGVVPIASFSDYACVFCRVLTPRLQDLEARAGRAIAVTWHELPLLGPSSARGARAALAAGLQGRYAEAHARLIRAAFQPTDPYLREVARDLDLDAAQLLADMDSPTVTDALHDSQALAQLFGMVGTPALVVGRTLVQGAIGPVDLDRLIARERADGPVPGC